MFAWIKDNLLTIAILLGLAGAVFAIVFSLIRDKKKGRSSCGGGCAHCPMAGKCHQRAASAKK
ncbi:MAG: FeoB-associated Cys-rich membrane protein [Clostridia bacterium]|nr:FeoB-associated Cys-rich membrane protein [Clostridia bacterium]